jgi:hypothetical protein
MMAVYRGQLPDQVPVAIYSRYLPRGTRERASREMGLAIIDWHPIASLLAPPWHLQSNYLSEVKGAELSVRFRWQDGRRIERRTYQTPVGDVFQESSVDPTYGSDWIQRFYIQTPEDYKVMTWLVEHTVFRRHESGLLASTENLGDDGVVLGRIDRCPYQKVLIELAGPERFLTDLYVEPEPACELLDVIDRRMDEVFTMVLESQAEVIWQPDNVTADLTPPAAMVKYCLPYYAKHGRELREAGKRYVIHLDGRLRPLKEHLTGAAFDCVESFSVPEAGGNMTLAEAMAAWPGKIILPNFPAPMCLRPDAEIEAFLARLLAEAGTSVPWMLQLSEDIPPGQWQRILPILCRFMAVRGRCGK